MREEGVVDTAPSLFLAKLKIANAAQLVGNLPHHRLRQSPEWPEQPPPIDRARLINHHLAGASVAGHSCWKLDPQDVPPSELGCAGKDPRARMVCLIQQIGLDHDDRPHLPRFAAAPRIQVGGPQLPSSR
jgi:hypothetical protein